MDLSREQQGSTRSEFAGLVFIQYLQSRESPMCHLDRLTQNGKGMDSAANAETHGSVDGASTSKGARLSQPPTKYCVTAVESEQVQGSLLSQQPPPPP